MRCWLWSVYEVFCDCVVKFVVEIVCDLFEFMVYDILYIDVLWEMVDFVVGMDFDLNLVEVFVFGGVIFIYDFGFSFVVYL